MDKIMELDLKKLKYFVVPVERRGQCDYMHTHDMIFEFWRDQWTTAFNKTGAPKKGWEDHFTRQSLVSAISYDDKMIGCLLFTFYDATALSAQGSEYFSYINEDSIGYIKDRNLKDAMSVEYLIIDPKFKRNSLGVSLGKVIISLSAYVAEDQGMDCIISMPISTTKVDKMLSNVGARTIQPKIEKYGYTLNLMLANTQPANKGIDPGVRGITDELWLRRFDYTRNYTRVEKNIVA